MKSEKITITTAMRKFIIWLHSHHKKFWIKERLLSLVSSIALLTVALLIQKAADNYVVKTWWTAVWDLLLNNIQSRDIDWFIILSTLTFTFAIVILNIFRPKYMLFTIKSLALFVIIRSFFISLTHLWIQPHQIKFDSKDLWFWMYDLLYNSKNDFFFSGHTWMPFLMALIFHKEKLWRNIFILTSIIFWTSVIVGHIHYSIDVFASPFITFTIYTISKVFFKKDYELTL